MDFIPTKQELLLLQKLKKTPLKKENIINTEKNSSVSANALQGALAKGFVQEQNGILIITELGKKQI